MINKILAAVDFSNLTEPVCQYAESLAGAFACELSIIHVAAPDPEFVGYEAGPQTVRDQRAHELKEERRQLHEMVAALNQKGIKATSHLIEGPTVETILKRAKDWRADLVVLGSHGHGAIYTALLGSVSEEVLRKAICPVLIVPASSL